VTKSGAGTQTLSGNNTYTGNTTVSAGTLELTGCNNNDKSTTYITNRGKLRLQANGGNTSAGVSSVLGSSGDIGQPTGGDTIHIKLRSDLRD